PTLESASLPRSRLRPFRLRGRRGGAGLSLCCRTADAPARSVASGAGPGPVRRRADALPDDRRSPRRAARAGLRGRLDRPHAVRAQRLAVRVRARLPNLADAGRLRAEPRDPRARGALPARRRLAREGDLRLSPDLAPPAPRSVAAA